MFTYTTESPDYELFDETDCIYLLLLIKSSQYIASYQKSIVTTHFEKKYAL